MTVYNLAGVSAGGRLNRKSRTFRLKGDAPVYRGAKAPLEISVEIARGGSYSPLCGPAPCHCPASLPPARWLLCAPGRASWVTKSPGKPPISLALGDPSGTVPDFVREALAA